MRLFCAIGLVAVSGLFFSRPVLAQGDPAAMDYQDPATTPKRPAPVADGETSRTAGTSRAFGARGQWYGLPLVVADLAAIGTTAAGFGMLVLDPYHNPHPGWPVLFTGIGAYAFDGLIVHAANGEIEKGFGSLGLRVGLAGLAGVTGALLGAADGSGCHSSPNPDDYCGLAYVAWGFTVGVGTGMVAASLIDNALLAYKRPAEPSRPTFSFAPVVDPRRGVAGLGLNGTW